MLTMALLYYSWLYLCGARQSDHGRGPVFRASARLAEPLFVRSNAECETPQEAKLGKLWFLSC